MKKLFTLFIAVALIFTLAACGETEVQCEDGQTLIDGVCEDPNVAPVISGLTDVVIVQGDVFDPTAGVTASDDKDGDITANVVAGFVNLSQPGEYTLTYTVVDSWGAKTEEVRNITVLAPNTLPVLAGVADLNIQKGAAFDPNAGVTATDAEDGDITADIEVSGTVDVNTIGTYTLTYTVEDADGGSVSVERDIVVTVQRINNLPDIQGAMDVEVEINTAFDPAAGVTAIDAEDGDLTASLVIDASALDLAANGVYPVVYTSTDLEGGEKVLTINVTVFTPNAAPVLAGLDDVDLVAGDDFDPLAGVTATDAEDGDLTASVIVNFVDISSPGTYTLYYQVQDSAGTVSYGERKVNVSPYVVELTYPSGFFNYKFADTQVRHTFMAAAERYLLETMVGGVPVFANGGFTLFSSRMQLPVEQNVAVMGFGTAFATMSADDSAVLMDDGNPGNAGEYTYRTTMSDNPATFNHWLSNDSNSSTAVAPFLDSLYTYVFNDDKTGYEVIPSMAAANPEPIDAVITDTGKLVSNVWRITLKDGLEWGFHPDIDTSGFAADTAVLDANDFVETFKIALEDELFRAITGGGDFLTESQAIVNAQEFVDGTVDWDQVGIKMIDDLTFEFTFVNQMSDWNVRYWLSDNTMTPMHLEMYDELTERDVDGGYLSTTYGTSPTTVAAHGTHLLEFYAADDIILYTKNAAYRDQNESFYTGYSYAIIQDSAVRFAEYEAGKLDVVGLPTEKYDEYKDHPGIKRVPGATTFRIMINGLGTVDNQLDQFFDSTYTPEPILANQNFKNAMFWAIDRQELAEQVLKTSTTQMYLFSNAYMVDPELGVPYRQTEQGMSVGEAFSPETHGYNADAAHALYLLAIEELVAAGTYAAGTAEVPTVIEIDLNIFSGSVSQQLFGDFIADSFEAVFYDDVNHINVQVNVTPKDFPSIYYDYMMVGNFDLSIGGISGSTLNAASFLDVFSSDNRGGFTLNWGIDTSNPDIFVEYTDSIGRLRQEMWSFDAITAVLNGEVYISNGAEATVPAPRLTGLTPTTVSFKIEMFDDPGFNILNYTVFNYDPAEGYLPVDGLVEVVPTQADITVTGLKPAWDEYPDRYEGDYYVEVCYESNDPVIPDGCSELPWFMTDSLLTDVVETEVLETSAELAVSVSDEDYARVLSSIVVFEEGAEGVLTDVTADLTIVSTDLSALTLDGLTGETWYQIVFTFDDGHQDFYWLESAAAPAA